MAKILKLPVDQDGVVQSWEGYGCNTINNFEFEETMEFIGIIRGRSAAQFLLRDSSGREYNMFMSEALNVLQKATIMNGKVTGRWTFCKKGRNYSLRFIY